MIDANTDSLECPTQGEVYVIESDAEGNAFELREIDCPTCGANAGKQFVGVRGGL